MRAYQARPPLLNLSPIAFPLFLCFFFFLLLSRHFSLLPSTPRERGRCFVIFHFLFHSCDSQRSSGVGLKLKGITTGISSQRQQQHRKRKKNMQESNIHSSYPNTVIIHRGNRIVFLALPDGATWEEARCTYVSLMNLNSKSIMLAPFFTPFADETPEPYANNAIIEWPMNNSSIHAVAVEATSNHTWTALAATLRPLEKRDVESVTAAGIPPAITEYLKVMQPAPHPRG